MTSKTNPHPSPDRVEAVTTVLHEKFGVQCSLRERCQWRTIARAAINAIPESESVTVMREALEPLVSKADRFDEKQKVWGKDYSDGFTVSISLGTCRKARAALTRIGRSNQEQQK